MKLRAATPALALVLAIACSSATSSVINDRLYFGTEIPAGGSVSDADWEAFVRTFVTPRLPKGFSVLQGNGQWQDAQGKIWRERGYIIEVTHLRSEDEKAIEEIAVEYKRRFGQDAVLRVTTPATMKFY